MPPVEPLKDLIWWLVPDTYYVPLPAVALAAYALAYARWEWRTWRSHR